MKKKRMHVVIPVLLIAAIMITVLLQQKASKEEIPLEKVPPENSFDTADMIIALVVIGDGAFQFILSNGNEMSVCYGQVRGDYGVEIIDGVAVASSDTFIKSIDFMKTVEVWKTVTVPEHIYIKILSLAHEIVEEKSGKLLHSTGGSNIAIFPGQDVIYEANFLYFDENTKEKELMDILSKYSPIVVRYYSTSSTRGTFEEK